MEQEVKPTCEEIDPALPDVSLFLMNMVKALMSVRECACVKDVFAPIFSSAAQGGNSHCLEVFIVSR